MFEAYLCRCVLDIISWKFEGCVNGSDELSKFSNRSKHQEKKIYTFQELGHFKKTSFSGITAGVEEDVQLTSAFNSTFSHELPLCGPCGAENSHKLYQQITLNS